MAALIACGGPDGGVDFLLEQRDLPGFAISQDSAGALEMVAASGPGFEESLHVRSTAEKTAVVEHPVEAELASGDVLSVTVFVRGAGGQSNPEVRFEPGISRFSAALKMAAPAGAEWTKYQYPFKLRRDYAPGEAKLSFRVTAGEVVEVGGLKLVHHGKKTRVADLPCTRLDYDGSGADAAWRKEAAARIEKNRKGNLAVTVKDASGEVVKDAEVQVRMKKHAFGFGSAVNVRAFHNLSGNLAREDVERYRAEIPRLFNRVVFENATKWPAWEDLELQPKTIETVDWMLERGIAVRGHVLIWPSWRWLPERLREFEDDPAALRRESLEHIRDEVTALRGKIFEWDVMNEPYSNHDLMDIAGEELMVEWFRAAREADPKAKLYINDFGILTGNNEKHRDHYEKTIAYLLEKGAPLDGIGLQGHFSSEVTPPEELLRRLDRFARFGKDLQVTEFDIDTVDAQLQADYTRDAMTALFSHPAVTGFVMWGFWEGRHWKPTGAMYEKDWSPKPNAKVYEDLVFKTWWTEESGQTDGEGRYAVRGFIGEYEVEVKRGDAVRKVEVTLPCEGAAVSVEL